MKKQEKIFVHNDNQANQSCPPMMQEDITRSINEQHQRIVRSQQFLPRIDDSQDEKQQQKNQKQTKNQFQRVQKSYSEQKIQVKTIIKKKGTQFDCEKVQSVEYSCEEESYRSASNKSQNKNDHSNSKLQSSPLKDTSAKKQKRQNQGSPQKRMRFLQKMEQIKEDSLNVLIAGASDMGKTIFIKCFKKKQKKSQEPFIKKRTSEIKYILGIDENIVNRRNYVHFIDLPGFQQNQVDKYLRVIKRYAQNQWKSYKIQPQKDKRIHCCLYFMRGPRIKQSDLTVMKQLSLWFNLIPVIAKSDQYTRNEIFQIKQEFQRRANEKGIHIFDIQEFYRIKLGTQGLNKMMQSPFGRFPPFVVTSSYQKQSPQSDFVRKYPWGKVEIQNKQHSDFGKLCEILSGDIKSQLVNNLFDIEALEDQQGVENIEGVIGEEIREDDKTTIGWKTKLVVGSAVVALLLAFVGRKGGSSFGWLKE